MLIAVWADKRTRFIKHLSNLQTIRLDQIYNLLLLFFYSKLDNGEFVQYDTLKISYSGI